MSDERQCECGSTNTHDLDFVPAQVIVGSSLDVTWMDAAICEDCGSFVVKEVTEDDVREAEEEYVEVLIENDLIDEDKAADVLGD